MITPKNWNEVTIEKYIKLNELYKNESDEIELILKRLAILLDLTYEEVEGINLMEYHKIKEDLTFLNNEPKQNVFKETFIIDEIEFKFIDLNKMTLGNWVDLQFYQEDLTSNIHRILNILYKNSTNTDKSELLLKKLDIETALSAFFFFYLLGLSFIPSDIQDCSMLEKAITEMEKMKKFLEEQLPA